MGNSDSAKIFALRPGFRNPVQRRLFSFFNPMIERILLLQRLNEVYESILTNGDKDGSFLDNVLRTLRVEYEISGPDRSRIPGTGPVVVVANHPFGAIEGIILAHVLLSVRDDAKIIANYLLQCIPEMRRILIPVDPFGGQETPKKNIRPLKDAIGWLRNGGMLGIFPAGGVSHIHLTKREITDPEWSETVAGIVRSGRAGVLPVYFDGSNSLFFQLAGLVHRRLRTVLLPRELLNKGNRSLRVRIGNLIPFERIQTFGTTRESTAYLRFQTYALKHERGDRMLRTGGDIIEGKRSMRDAGTIPDGPDPELMCSEIRLLSQNQTLLENDEYVVFHSTADRIPNLLHEIGRLREVSFQSAGEGTGRAVDLDRFDLYYVHLILWNKLRGELVGAYRIGPADKIIQRFGINGLYTNTLFDYKPRLRDHLSSGLELGRSFIRPSYQKQYTPLFFLWKGICRFISQNPQYKILFGPVTISNSYSELSRQLIVSFLKSNNYIPAIARFVKPKLPPCSKTVKKREAHAANILAKDIEQLSALISDIEHDRKGLPILLKQYIKLGGKLMGFNVDPAFSNGLDGLIIVDLTQCNRRLLAHYMGKEGLHRFLEFHGISKTESYAA
ncbi:MAG: hypothetical protein A4E64_00979 [Syntrophorhabdus sp. PtaU1.Bin058]|nr:MAG: hypothetical protein A4E64_00979 [Syntrophorhabdus sp. PtaU1.Bin058]